MAQHLPPGTQNQDVVGSFQERQLSLDEKKLALERDKFEYDKGKSKVGFLNNNFGIVITAIVGLGTVAVSYLQLTISNQTSQAQIQLQSKISEGQIRLEQQKVAAEREREDRKYQFELTRFFIEKSNEINTGDVRQVRYIRDIVLSSLPTELGSRIARRMADNASTPEIRASWNDVYVNLQLSVSTLPPNQPTPTVQQSLQITADYVIGKFPAVANKQKEITNLLSAAEEFGLKGPRQVAIFLAVILRETALLRATEENLNYTPARLSALFPSKFNPSEAEVFRGQPEAIANRIYANRGGNGDEASGDGWRYRGRGYLLLFHRAGYARVGKMIGIDIENDPDRMSDSVVSARASAAIYVTRVRERDLVQSAVRGISGGTSGLSQVQALYETLLPETPKVTEGLGLASNEERDSTDRSVAQSTPDSLN